MHLNLHKIYNGVFALGLLAVATSCVDNDYDLSKDIDLTVTVGGNLGIPSSSTECYTLSRILNLSANSSIQPVGSQYGLADGDYVLVQSGTPTSSSVSIPQQKLNNISAASASIDIPYVMPATGGNVAVEIPEFSTLISLSDNSIDKAVVSISSAETDARINLDLSMTAAQLSGVATFKPGFAVEFPSACTIELAKAVNGVSVEGNKLVFNAPVAVNVNSSLVLPLVIKKLDMTLLPEGQGLYAPGKFLFEQEISYGGPLSVRADGSSAGQSGVLKLMIKPTVTEASIISVTGKINPQINVASSSFAINGIPDFLKEPGNNLDVENPQIYLSVKNTSECEIDVNASLTAIDDNGKRTKVWLGKEHNTAPITVKPFSEMADGVTRICISTTGHGDSPADLYVAVPDLSKLIATIPQRIIMDDIDVKVSQERDVTFRLGNYTFAVDYKAVVPLGFGPDLHFTYTTDEGGWDEDLSDYSFKRAEATFTVSNTVPLDMVPEVKAIDRQGRVINDVVATVEGKVLAGQLGAAKESKLAVTFTSDAKNIGNLDGVRFFFKATCGENAVGVPLNVNQSLKFTDIRLKLVGGVGVDLN